MASILALNGCPESVDHYTLMLLRVPSLGFVLSTNVSFRPILLKN